MNRLVWVMVAFISAGSFAQDKTTLPVPPEKLAEFNARTGGMVSPIDNGKRLLVLDAREGESIQLEEAIELGNHVLKLPSVVEKTQLPEGVAPYAFCAGKQNEKCPAIILFYNRKGDASLSVFPENAIACVNVHGLVTDDPKLYKERLGKEYWRSVGFIFGAYGLQMPGCVLQPVSSAEQLDAIKGRQLGPNRFNMVLKTSNALGIQMIRTTTYMRACQEGWAPPPTNDVQRAIWAKFRSDKERGPANAIKIEPPGKKK